MSENKFLISSRKRMNRRTFIKQSGFITAGTVLGSAGMINALPGTRGNSVHRDRKKIQDYEVVVIGAGVSGLMAARRLVDIGVTDIKLLEARGRVGGRTMDREMAGGGIAEDGGEWIGPTQDAVLDLMDDLSIGKYRTHTTGRTVDDTSGDFGKFELLDYLQARERIDNLAKTVPLEDPWNAHDAEIWDAMTLQDWMDQNMYTEGGKALITFEVELFMGKPEFISFLYFLFYVHSATDYEHLSEKAEAWRIVGGQKAIADAMADDLGDIIELNAPVSSIDYNDTTATIQYGGGEITARKVIIAIMPKDINNIGFSPELPEDRAALQRAWMGTPALKVHVSYESPFWRDEGYSGMAISDTQFIAFAVDNSPPDGSVGVLGGFVDETLGVPHRYQERYEATLNAFEHFFGPEARNAVDYKEYDWGLDPWTSGAVSVLRPGVLTNFGPAIREPVGPIHWAGAETSTIWCGYIDGGVRAGKRTAEEVTELL